MILATKPTFVSLLVCFLGAASVAAFTATATATTTATAFHHFHHSAGAMNDRSRPQQSSTVLANAAAGKGFAPKSKEKITMYPPMSHEEIAKWMGHIPVYAVTNENGNGQVLQLDNTCSKQPVFYFFLSPVMADVHRQQLVESSTDDLTVSGLFLGNIWFKLLTSQTDVDHRLVPDARDLISARGLLTMEEEDEEVESSVLMRAMNESPRFNAVYNEVPLFSINNMPLNQQSQKTKKLLNDMVSSHYIFFSSQNMLATMEELADDGGSPEDSENDLLSLHELVECMMKESTIDFRNIVLVPSTPILDGPVSDSVFQEQLQDPVSFIGGTFFQSLFTVK